MAPRHKSEERVRLDPPAALRELIGRLRARGGRVWAVGGVVRDALQGRTAHDWDLATDLPPDAIRTALPEAEARDARLGAFHLRIDGRRATVTALREEHGYSDHRRPDTVRFVGDPVLDAARRDFTVNALYVGPEGGVVLDPVGGLEDLRDGVLRTIGPAAARLAEDPLRMLRAVRFAAAAGLSLDPELRAELTRQAHLVTTLAAERVFDELTRAFTGPGRGRALRALVETGLARHVLPEVVPMAGVPQPPDYHPEGDVLTHVCLVLDAVSPGDPVQAWSAVLHDAGKPATFERAADRIRFHGHDVLSADMARSALQRMHAPRELTEAVAEVCRDHIRFASLPEMGRGKRERWLRSPRFAAHLEFHRADCQGSHGDLSIYRTARRWLEELPPEPPPPLCTGKDVLALGVAPGPQVGEILRALQQRLDAEDVSDRDTALRMLRDVVADRVKDAGPGSDR